MSTSHDNSSAATTAKAWLDAFATDMPAMLQRREAHIAGLAQPDGDPQQNAASTNWLHLFDRYYELYAFEKRIQTEAAALAAADEGARGQIAKGFGCLVLGGIITGITYLAAKDGGTYIITWGAVAFGAFQLVLGVLRLAQVRVQTNKLRDEISRPRGERNQ